MGERRTSYISILMGLCGVVIMILLVVSCGVTRTMTDREEARASAHAAVPAEPAAAEPEADGSAGHQASGEPLDLGPIVKAPDRQEGSTHNSTATLAVAETEPAADRPLVPATPATPVTDVPGVPPAPPEPELSDTDFDPAWDFRTIPANDVHEIDFRNDVDYLIRGVGQLAVVDGFGSDDFANANDAELSIGEVSFGDLDGDGRDEAAVTVSYSLSGHRATEEVNVFRTTDGSLELVGTTWGWAEIADVKFRDGMLVVENWEFTGGAECCPTGRARTEWTVGRYSLRNLAQYYPATWLDLGSETTPFGEELKFNYGTNHALVSATNDGADQQFTFQASGGRSVQVAFEEGSGAAMRVRDVAGIPVGDIEDGEQLNLPTDGSYTASFVFDPGASRDAQIVADITIAQPRALAAPTWTTKSFVDVEVVADDKERHISIFWPHLTSAHQGVNLDAVNATIKEIAFANLEEHRALVEETCEPDEASIYDLTYLPTLMSYDLISFELREFVCLCESGDTSNWSTVVIDLNTGAVLDSNDLVADESLLAEVAWTHAQEHYPYLFQGVADTDQPASLAITEVALGGSAVAVTFTQDLLDAYELQVEIPLDVAARALADGIATRALSGADVDLPHEETCGC